jgi:hypothetical protein
MHSVDVGKWSASRYGQCIPSKRVPGTNWIGGCVGPRTPALVPILSHINPINTFPFYFSKPILIIIFNLFLDRQVESSFPVFRLEIRH